MKKTILIIEDDENVRSNTKILLQEEGYNVLTANNGNIGVTVAKEMNPNLIISDIMMPEKDGYEVLKTLSNTQGTNNIPFLFVTAKVDISDLRKGMQLGADDYLFKPYKSNDLLKAIETRLKKYENIKTVFTQEEEEHKRPKNHNNSDAQFLNINGKHKFVKLSSIMFVSAENQYTNLGLDDGTRSLIRKSMREWENSLPKKKFLRIHRSAIINLDYVSNVEKCYKNSFKVYLKDCSETFIISRRYASKISSAFKTLSDQYL